VSQPIDYAPPGPSRRRTRIKQIAMISAAVIVLLMGVCAVKVTSTAKRSAFHIHTESNLRQIGQTILIYAQENQGVFPPDFAAMLRTQQISAEVFTCSNSDDTRARGPTMQQLLQEFAKPGHCSFIYVGAGLREPVRPDAVIAFDSPLHEDFRPISVLWGDGHTDDVPFYMLIQILEDLSIGKNPPSTSTNLTMGQAKQLYETKCRTRLPGLQTGGWRIPTTRPAD
jgi:hypothetical protein